MVALTLVSLCSARNYSPSDPTLPQHSDYNSAFLYPSRCIFFLFFFCLFFYVARTPAILAIVVAGCISEHCWSSNGKRQTFVRWSWTHLSIFVLSFILLLFNHTISRWVSTRMICNILRRTLTELKKGACDADLVASRNFLDQSYRQLTKL